MRPRRVDETTREALTRRDFLARGGAAVLAAALPITQIELAFAKPTDNFTFAYISDAHIEQIRDGVFVRNWDRGLVRAAAETGLLHPAPDFVIFGGDLAQSGTRPELDHGAEILSQLRAPMHCIMGEHDYYFDLGEYWSRLFGSQWYSFDHKGVHFVALNSVLTDENWTHNRWATPAERMQAIGRIDGPDGSPFMVGARQRAWLAEDLTKVSNHTPVMVFSHSPLQKIYRPWNFWTEDAEQVHALLARFDRVHVIYGHVHQLQYNQIGNISFHSAMATAWPYPYPQSYAQAESYLPKLTVPMNRADPFFERDGTGWQFMNVTTGRPEMYYNLYNNAARTRAVDPKSLPLEDGAHQAPDSRIPPQQHY